MAIDWRKRSKNTVLRAEGAWRTCDDRRAHRLYCLAKDQLRRAADYVQGEEEEIGKFKETK